LLEKTQPRTKYEVDQMTRCWIMAIWTFHPQTGHHTSDTGHASDFIFCPMLLCSALDRQQYAD